MDWLALVAQLGGSALGQQMSQMDKDEAMRLIKSSTDAYGKIQIPQLQKLVLQTQGRSEMDNIKEDPRYRDEQNAADSNLNDIIKSGGLTLSDRAALNAIRNKTARMESAGRNAILGGMAARGTLDSGAGLAAQLQGNQESADTLASADEATAGQAQARAYQAIKDRAAMASQGLARTDARSEATARANDAINAGNTAILNTAARYNAGIPQQNFNNSLELTNAQTGANANLADKIAGRAADTQNRWQAAGNSVSSVLKNSGGSSGASGSTTTATPATEPNYSEHETGVADHGDGLAGEQTRPDGRTIVGYRPDGSPIYSSESGSNF